MYTLLFALAAVVITTKLFGELARRFGQPSVLGELLAGVLLGGGAIGLLDPHDPAMHALGDLGLFVLVFQIGVHTDVRALRRLGSTAASVASVGVILPFAGGFFVARAFGASTVAAVIAAAALTATSKAIAARLLSELGVQHTAEGQVTISAAIAGDIAGLIVISVIAAMAAAHSPSAGGAARVAMISAAFIAVVFAAGRYAIPPLFRVLDRIRAKGSLGLFGLSFGLLLAAIAMASGTAMIVGAFVAGAILHSTPQRHEIERTTAQIGHFLIPVFFAVVGASVDLPALMNGPALALAGALIAVAIAGKMIAGYSALNFTGNRALVGAAMVPRGEVGLIFAQMGLATGAITPAMFGAITLMVAVTTFVAPPLMHVLVRRDESLEREDAEPVEAHNGNGRRHTAVGRRH